MKGNHTKDCDKMTFEFVTSSGFCLLTAVRTPDLEAQEYRWNKSCL